jgi:hypothetical protein
VASDSVVNHSFDVERGSKTCRGCGSRDLFSALDLGHLPIANELSDSVNFQVGSYPLHLKICKSCCLGQVADVVTRERIFKDYRYLSSTSSTFLQHAKEFVDQCVQKYGISNKDWVLEIASNDGYLLKNFAKFGITAIGIEPAENVAEIARSIGVSTISEFFGSHLAEELYEMYGFPKLIIANNVMAHVPDLNDFIKGIAVLSGPDTKISVENPSLFNILFDSQFDTIYHEHYSYLSATSVSKLGLSAGLTLTSVQKLSTHGGSNRYWLEKSNPVKKEIDPQVAALIDSEKTMGLFEELAWSNYAKKVNKILLDFTIWINSAVAEGRRVVGYGAAAKASTLLNSSSTKDELISVIADASLEKQGRFMPPNSIEIISPSDLRIYQPTDVVIFPWNIKEEIAIFLQGALDQPFRMWCAIPEMHEVKVYDN